MGNNQFNPIRKFESANRIEVNFLSVRGTGLTGKWHLELLCESGDGRARYLVEFLPQKTRYTRSSMVNGAAEIPPVPRDLKNQFHEFIQEQCTRRGLPLRRTRQGPGWMLDQVASLLVNQEIEPGPEKIREVTDYIRWHLENPAYILPVEQKPKMFHFGDPEKGRFFLTETPPVG